VHALAFVRRAGNVAAEMPAVGLVDGGIGHGLAGLWEKYPRWGRRTPPYRPTSGIRARPTCAL
jgi:hypothetical protein